LKRRLFFALMSLAVLGVISVAAQERQSRSGVPPRPKLMTASFEYSFGDVKPGEPLTHSFEIRNLGDANLEIRSVNPSCGCTTSNFDKVIAPGKKGAITLVVEKTEEYKGEVVKTASVTTNDPDHQSFTLTMKANFKN